MLFDEVVFFVIFAFISIYRIPFSLITKLK